MNLASDKRLIQLRLDFSSAPTGIDHATLLEPLRGDSLATRITPAMSPSGRLMLRTNPSFTGSSAIANVIGHGIAVAPCPCMRHFTHLTTK